MAKSVGSLLALRVCLSTHALVAVASAQESVPALSVDGSPSGALVEVDGTPWGVLPHEDIVPQGNHIVVVHAEGYAAQNREVTVGLGRTALQIDLVSLAAATTAVAPAPSTSGGIDVGYVAAGSAAIGVGLIGVIAGIYGFAAPYQFQETPSGYAYERTNDGISALWPTAGSLAAAAGVVFLVVGLTNPSSSPSARRFDGVISA